MLLWCKALQFINHAYSADVTKLDEKEKSSPVPVH